MTRAVLLALVLLGVARAAPADDPAPCPARGGVVRVSTARHRLWTCANGRAEAEYPVALGTGGVGKRRQGDAKVPLGEYTLGPPRGSSQFHLFIPVGYPTALQRRNGFTGSAVGVHGPARGYEHLGSAANTAVDWTLGCIAVGSDAEIERIAAWMRRERVSRIAID